MLNGTNSNFNRSFNRRIVIETVRLHQPVSRSEIARLTGLTVQTVSNIVAGLIDEGFVIKRGRRAVPRGQPPLELTINPQAALSVGINLDRDRILGVLLDLNGDVLGRTEFEVNYPLPDEAIGLFEKVTHQLVEFKSQLTNRILGVGIALPTGKYFDPPDFPGWHSSEVKQELMEILGFPLYIDNDATVAAIWERLYGRGRAFKDFFYVYFGRSLGGGLISRGTPYYGFRGNAGEFGFTPAYPDHKAYDYGKTQPIERTVSLSGLYRALEAAGVDTNSITLVTLFEQEHPVMRTWLDQAIRLLVPALVTVDNLLDPEAIFLGGRLPHPLLEYLLQGLREHVPQRRLPGKSYPVQLLSGSKGGDAAALGAATLLMYEALAPTPDLVHKYAEPPMKGGL